jgi:hypothetical protein
MKRIKFKTIIVGLLISLAIEVLMPIIQTILELSPVGINFHHPLTYYLLWGYLAVVLSGIYVGFSKTNDKIINGMMVGIFYYIIFGLFGKLIICHHLGNNLLSYGYAMLKHALICAIAAWSSYKIKASLNSKNDVVTGARP